MNPSYKKICLLLAASDLKITDIEIFAKTLSANGLKKIKHDVINLRSKLNKIESSNYFDEIISPFEDKNKSSLQIKKMGVVEEKIIRLLILEANLTKENAAELLYKLINTRHPKLTIPNYKKKAFGYWLIQLQKYLTSSELLHLATIIRNEYVHEVNKDWLLK